MFQLSPDCSDLSTLLGLPKLHRSIRRHSAYTAHRERAEGLDQEPGGVAGAGTSLSSWAVSLFDCSARACRDQVINSFCLRWCRDHLISDQVH